MNKRFDKRFLPAIFRQTASLSMVLAVSVVWISLRAVRDVWGEESSERITIDSIPPIEWRLEKASDTASFQRPASKAMTYQAPQKETDAPYWQAESEGCRVGKDWQYPSGEVSVRSFHAPKAGKVRISGRAYKGELEAASDGVRVTIRREGTILWLTDLTGADGTGREFHLDLTLEQGETVSFLVESCERMDHDLTCLDPVVAYLSEDGKETDVYRASEGFSGEQGPVWTYESEAETDLVLRPLPPDYGDNFGAMIQYEWLREDKIPVQNKEFYGEKAEKHLNLAEKLFDDLADSLENAETLEAELNQLKSEQAAAKANPDLTAQEAEILYAKIRGWKRKLAFSNPLANFGPLFFAKRVPTTYNHEVMQYYGFRARPGGGLFILNQPGRSLEARDIFDGRLAKGSVLEPRLSFDAKKIVFSWVDLSLDRTYDPKQLKYTDPDEGFFHVWTGNIDGSDLKQLTDGSYEDVTPTWLPDGDIIFCSSRRRGYARCFWWAFTERWHVYTLHRMKPDGSDIKILSWHDTNEWFPTVAENGEIVYARWDYIDRDAVTHQNLWSTRPDGTNPSALYGNASPVPDCAFQAQPIPGTAKYVFTASAHHALTGGPLYIFDPMAGSEGMRPITELTPEIPAPEAESFDIHEYYDAPWPLSEKYFLCSYSPWPLEFEWEKPGRPDELGVYLLDIFGNRELIYRDPNLSATNPCPLRPRPTPPVLASQLPENAPPYGEMVVSDVYQGLGDKIERGRIKAIRVVQIFPKITRDSNVPPVGMAGEENGRAILGTVPVEEDGSAYFRVPAQTPFYLQVLDEKGRAYQTMRSLTYLQPGEKISCVGCHETRSSHAYSDLIPSAFSSGQLPTALKREASDLTPGEWGGRPFSYPEMIQPILDVKCVSCHNESKKEGGLDLTGAPEGDYTRSYIALCGDKDFVGAGTNPTNAAEALVPRFGMRNTIQVTEPGGEYGALGSRLLKILAAGHENVTLTPEEMAKLATWIDLNAIFNGTGNPKDIPVLLEGKPLPMPEVQ